MDKENALNEINEFIDCMSDTINDQVMTQYMKQEYFISHYDEAHQYINLLQTLAEDIRNNDGDDMLYRNVMDTTDRLCKVLSQFKQIIAIDSNAQTSDTTPCIDKLIEGSGSYGNTTGTSPEETNDEWISYTHMFVCDGKMHFIKACNNTELVKLINGITGSEAGNVHLYSIALNEIPLKQKTILSI